MDFNNLDNLFARPERGTGGDQRKVASICGKDEAMSNAASRMTRKVLARAGMCLLGTVGLMATTGDAKPRSLPIVIRGIPSTAPALDELKLAYLANFSNGSLDAAVDKLGAGALQYGPFNVPNGNPVIEPRPGEIFLSVFRPVGLDPDTIPASGVWATPVNFGPGTVSRIRATFIAPVGPIPSGGFAIGVNGKTGDENDLAADTRIGATVNVRPDFLVRFGAPFGAAAPARVVLPEDVKAAMFSTTGPQPFTIELTVDRKEGTGLAKLMVIDQVFEVPFVLSTFPANSGPAITAVGPGIAVNSNAPGQTASVRVREFRIYAE